jgi:kynurenine formamidase
MIMPILDLSVLVNEMTPVYPGDPAIQITSVSSLAADGNIGHLLSLGTHAGTHIDAPMHMLAGGVGLDQIPIETFVGAGRCITINGDFDVAQLEAANIQSGEIVLFCTGMSERYNQPDYFQSYPAMTVAAAKYLIGKGVKMVGLDTCSADNLEQFPIHNNPVAI